MANTKTGSENFDRSLVEEVETIKRLLILFLIKTGASQDELAIALQRDRSQVSRMIPRNKIKLYDRAQTTT